MSRNEYRYVNPANIISVIRRAVGIIMAAKLRIGGDIKHWRKNDRFGNDVQRQSGVLQADRAADMAQ